MQRISFSKSAVVLSLFTGLIPAFSVNAASTVTFKLAHLYNADHPYTPAIKKFAEEVKTLSQGRLVIKDYPSGQLGSEKDTCDAVSMDTVDMAIIGPGELAKRHKPIFIFDGPYVFRDVDHLLKTVASPVGQEMWNALAASSNIRVLNAFYYGKKHITTAKKAVRSPADMKGLKFRVIDSPMNVAIAKAFGASPVPMAFSELYLSLQQGVVDGQENPIPTIISQKFYEVQKYLILSGAITQAAPMAISEKKYKALPADLQKILTDSLNKMIVNVNNEILASEKNQIEFLKGKGMEVVEPDLGAFKEAAKVVIEQFEPQWGSGLYEKIQNVK